MGETAPPQAPAGSLAIGVSNVGLLGGGTVAPRLHSAIVERLRARIAVCRQHHLNCEGRYERSRAESSDRERENTLQLLTLVQHGQGTRKSSKHSKSSCAAPPDYRHHQTQQQPQMLSDERNDINGGQQASTGLGQRNSALIALQGSLKRRLVVNVTPTNNKRSNGVSDNAFLDFKKIKSNECIALGQNMYHAVDGSSQSINGAMPMEQVMHRKNGNITSNDMFNTTLKDIKKEPGENLSCSKHLDSRLSHENMFRYVNDNEEQLMDPELQELFNEFTYISVPPMTDIELQNMINITIKQDEPFNIDIGQQNQRSASSLPMDKIVIKSEYSPCLNPTRVGSPQMRPSSTGPTFSMSSSPLAASPSTTVAQNQGQSQVSSCVNRMNNWQELSHAQQLKQMAANRQHNLIQQHQSNTSSSWSNVPPTGQTSRQFGLEKVPSPFRQPQLSPHGSSVSTPPGSGSQQKVMGNYLYKSSSPNNSAEIMKPQDTNKNSMTSSHLPAEHHLGMSKPLFHYNPDQSNQQVSSVLGSQPKPGMQFTPQQPQSSTTAQHDSTQQVNTVSNQSLPRSSNFQQKMMPKLPNQPMPGLQYQPIHQQQEQQCNATSLGTNSSAVSCSSPNGYNTQQAILNQQMMEKTSIMQRQMQQQLLPGTEKCNNQDQLNRHLTRPPPDYKDQRRGTVGIQQANQFTGGLPVVGVNPDPTLPNSPSTNMAPQNQSHTSTNHGARMPALQGSPNMYGNVSCPQQSMYNGMSQTSPNHMGTSQNGNVPRQPAVTSGTNMSPFNTQSGNNGPTFRPNGPSAAGQRSQNVINNSPPTQKWMSSEVKRQDLVGYANANQFSNQSVQGMISHQQFPHRALSMPNQVNPGVQMTTLNTMAPSNSGQTIDPLRGFNHGQSPLRSQILPSMNQAAGVLTMPSNTFNSTNQISQAFPRSDSSNDLGSFDFLSQNGGLGSSPNGDSDFIDALLKTGHINDDWMKDINLDEIFKGHS